MSELQEVSDEMYKLTLAHEIVLNGDFKLQMGNFSPFRCI